MKIPHKSLEMATLSKIAYYDPKTVKYEIENNDVLVANGYYKATGIKVGNLVAYVFEADYNITIAFRGTDDINDWLYNLDATHENGFHKGFYEAYIKMKDIINDHCNQLSSSKDIYVTGHSLGGAIAVIFANEDVQGRPFMPPLVYTFGQPRVAMKWRQLRLTHYDRFTRDGDIVPHVPPALFKKGYRHQGNHYHIVDENTILLNPNRWYLFWQGVKRVFKRKLDPLMVMSNHSEANYEKDLKKYRSKD